MVSKSSFPPTSGTALTRAKGACSFPQWTGKLKIIEVVILATQVANSAQANAWRDHTARHRTKLDVPCSLPWGQYFGRNAQSASLRDITGDCARWGTVFLPQPCSSCRDSVLSMQGLVPGRDTTKGASLFLLTPFLRLELTVPRD